MRETSKQVGLICRLYTILRACFLRVTGTAKLQQTQRQLDSIKSDKLHLETGIHMNE